MKLENRTVVFIDILGFEPLVAGAEQGRLRSINCSTSLDCLRML